MIQGKVDQLKFSFCSSVTNVIAIQLRAFSTFSYLRVQCSVHAGSVTVQSVTAVGKFGLMRVDIKVSCVTSAENVFT